MSKIKRIKYTRYYYVDDNVPNFMIYKKVNFINNIIIRIINIFYKYNI